MWVYDKGIELQYQLVPPSCVLMQLWVSLLMPVAKTDPGLSNVTNGNLAYNDACMVNYPCHKKHGQ